MERDKFKADASDMLERSRRIGKEGDDIAFEIQNIREAEKRLATTRVVTQLHNNNTLQRD